LSEQNEESNKNPIQSGGGKTSSGTGADAQSDLIEGQSGEDNYKSRDLSGTHRFLNMEAATAQFSGAIVCVFARQ
jgi:hypothetical protein